MRLLIVGATGQTGEHLVKQALGAEHQVTALVRDPSKLGIQNDNLKVVKADIFDEEEMKKHLEGQDAVMSTLGFSLLVRPVVGYADVTKVLTDAMKSTNVKRVIFMHAWHTHKPSRDNAGFFIRWFFLPIIAPLLDNMRVAEIYLEENCKDLDYTVVLPPGLVNTPVTDKGFQSRDNVWYMEGASQEIARADVARYMLSLVEDESSYRVTKCFTTEQ